MSVRKYVAIKDNTITNAYESDLVTRGTGSNMGLADSLEVFSIYAQANTSSNEQTRILVQFPVSSSDTGTTILEDRTNNKIPASGSVSFYLRLYNVVHDQTLPRDFTLLVSPVSQSWEEGYGLDMENYSDLTYGGTGSNWMSASSTSGWENVDGYKLEGGSFLSSSQAGSPGTLYDAFNYKKTFVKGTEDLEIEITDLVEQWIYGTAGTNPSSNPGFENYGIGLMLTASQESGSRSYYTKKFSARSSEYYFKRPAIEARWDNSKKDHRGNFYISSSNVSGEDNLNTLYLYNYVRGQPKNIDGVGTGSIFVTVYTSASGGDQLTTTTEQPVSGGHVDTGIYSASFALYTTASQGNLAYDRWFSGNVDPALATPYHTGSFTPKTFDSDHVFLIPRYVTTVTNLQDEYYNDDITRLRLFTRLKDWSPTIYTVASREIENSFIEDAYYKVYREFNEVDVITYGTGSDKHTRLSYDTSGSYFDLDMRLLEPRYSYAIKFLYYINGAYEEQPEIFKFRVKE